MLLRTGSSGKTAFVRPFEEVYAGVLGPVSFSGELCEMRETLAVRPEEEFIPGAHPQLETLATLGPRYTEADSLAAVSNRYERMGKGLSLTLQALGKDEQCRAVTKKLRDEGWLDWHLLLAIANIVLNVRMQGEGLD